MAPGTSDFIRLALTAHEAAVDSSLWPTFLAGYARAIGADFAFIHRHHFAEHRSELLETTGMSQRFTASYHEQYSRMNIWRERGRHLYAAGRVIFDPEMCSRQALKQSEFYNDFLLPGIGTTHSVAGVLACRNGQALTLTALRDDRQPGWEEEHRPRIGALIPHVVRAWETQGRLAALEAGEAALNELAVGILLLEAGRTIVFSNRAAEAVIRDCDGLLLRGDRLTAVDPGADAALQRIVAHAIAPDRSIEAPPDVLVPRVSGRRPYYVTASPLRRTLRPFLGIARPVALVRVTDPDRRRLVRAEVLTQGYGLTRKEAKLAVALAQGHTLEQAAVMLEIRYETARTHLRRVLSKTQTSRQAELIELLTRFAQ